MRSAEELRAAARRAGIADVVLERVPAPGGGFAWSARMRFNDPWAAARLLQVLSDDDAADPTVRVWALEISAAAAAAAGYDQAGPTLTPELRAIIGDAIIQNVQAHVRFIHEPEETFQGATMTMAAGAGDCDDHARLVYALARAAGLPAKLVFFEEGNEPVHVVAQIGDGIGFRWAETTLCAEFGEHPYDALARVGADASADPMRAPGGVGFLGLDFVTPGDVASRKEQLNAAVSALDTDVLKCGALDTATLSAWNEFLAAWRVFDATEPSFFNAGGQGRQAADYADQISEWQTRVAAVCPLSGPRVPQSKSDPVVSTVQALAVIAVAGAAAWVLTDTQRTVRILRGRAA